MMPTSHSKDCAYRVDQFPQECNCPARWLQVLEDRKDILVGDDGYYFFWPEGYIHGGFNSADLRRLADHLDEKNKEWHDTILSDPNI